MKNYQKVKQAGTPYDSAIRKAAEKHGVNYDLMHKLIYIESKFDPKAVSPTGAKGIAQFVGYTGKAFGLKTDADRFDPYKSIEASAAYLGHLSGKLDGDEALMSLAYNQGLGGSGRKQVEAAKRGDWSGVKPEGLKYMQNLSDSVKPDQFGRYKFGGEVTAVKPEAPTQGKSLEVKPSVPEVAPPKAAGFQSAEQAQSFTPTARPTVAQVEFETGYESPESKGVFEGTGTAVANAVANSFIGSAFHIRSNYGTDVLKSFYQPTMTNSYQFSDEDYKSIEESQLPQSYVESLGGARSSEDLKYLIEDKKRVYANAQESSKQGIGAQVIGGFAEALGDPLTFMPIVGQAGKAAQGMKIISRAGAARYASIGAQSGLAAGAGELIREAYVGQEADVASAIAFGGIAGAGLSAGLDGASNAMRRSLSRLEANETARNLGIDSDARLPQVIADEALPMMEMNGVRYKDNPVGDGSVVLENGMIISGDSPLHPKFAELERSAFGVSLGSIGEVGFKTLRSNNESIRGIALDLFRSSVGLESGASGRSRMVAADIHDMRAGRQRQFENEFHKLSEDVFKDPKFVRGNMSKDQALQTAYRNVFDAIEKPEKYLANLTKAEKALFEKTKQFFTEQREDMLNTTKYGNQNAKPLMDSEGFGENYTMNVYDDDLRNVFKQKLGGGEQLQEAIEKSWLYGDSGYFNNPSVRERYRKIVRNEHERKFAEQEKLANERAGERAATPEAKAKAAEKEAKLTEHERIRNESLAKAEKTRNDNLKSIDDEVSRLGEDLKSKIADVKSRLKEKLAAVDADKPAAKVRPEVELPAKPVKKVFKKEGSAEVKAKREADYKAKVDAWQKRVDSIKAKQKDFAKKDQLSADARKLSDSTKRFNAEQSAAEQIKRIEELNAKRVKALGERKAKIEKAAKETKENQAFAKKLADDMKKQKADERIAERNAKATLTDEQIDEIVKQIAHDKAFGIAQADTFGYSAATADAFDDSGKGIETNNFLEARHLFDSDSSIKLADGSDFKVNDLRSYQADRLIPAYARRVNGDVSIMGSTGKTMEEMKKTILDLRFKESKDGAFKSEGQALIDAVTRIAGMTTVKPDGANAAMLRALTNTTFMTKNAMMGIQNLTEVASMVVKGHTAAIFKGVPMMDKFMGGVYANDKQSIDALQGLLFGRELDDSLRPKRADMIEAIRANSTNETYATLAANLQWGTRELARVLPAGKVLQGMTNHLIDAARTATLNDIVTSSLRGTKGVKPEILKSAAITDSQYAGIESLIRDFITEGVDGKLTIREGIKNDPRAMDLWRLGDHQASEALQRSTGVSAMSSKQSGAGLQAVMQFKSFVLRSLNSTAIRSFYEATKNHRAIEQLAVTAVSLGMAGLFYMGRIAASAQGMSEAGRKEYLDKNLDKSMIGYAMLTRARGVGAFPSAISTAVGMIKPDLDAARAVRTTLTPKRKDSIDRPTKYAPASDSFLANALDQVPAAGLIANVGAVAENTAGLMGAKGLSDELAWRDALYNSYRNIIPNDPASQALLTAWFEKAGIHAK